MDAAERLLNMPEFYKEPTPPRPARPHRNPRGGADAEQGRASTPERAASSRQALRRALASRRSDDLRARTRCAGLAGPPQTWFALDVACRDLPVNSAHGCCRLSCRGLPPTSVSGSVQLRCSGLPSLDAERFELDVGCASLPPMPGGRVLLTLACSALPPAQDPRYCLQLGCQDLHAAAPLPGGQQQHQRRDVLVVLRTHDTQRAGSQPQGGGGSDVREVGRTEVAEHRALGGAYVFEQPVFCDWRTPQQLLHFDVYHADAAAAAARSAPLDLMLDCDFVGTATVAAAELDNRAEEEEEEQQRLQAESALAEAEEALASELAAQRANKKKRKRRKAAEKAAQEARARVHGLAEARSARPKRQLAVEITNADSRHRQQPLGTVTVVVTPDRISHGCPLAVVHCRADAQADWVEAGRTEVLAEASSPCFERGVTVHAPVPASAQLRVDLYHAPPQAAGEPGTAVDVARGCAYVGSARCAAERALGGGAEGRGATLQLADLRGGKRLGGGGGRLASASSSPARLRTVSSEGSTVTITGTALAEGVGAPVVMVSTVEPEPTGSDGQQSGPGLGAAQQMQGRTEVLPSSPDPKFEATVAVASKYKCPQKLRFDIYYVDGVAAGVESESAEAAQQKLAEAISARGLPPSSDWDDVKMFDEKMKSLETKDARKKRKKQEKKKLMDKHAEMARLNILKIGDYVGSAECWLGTLAQADDMALQLKIVNLHDEATNSKLKRQSSILAVHATAVKMTPGKPIVVASQLDGSTIAAASEDEIGRTELAKPASSAKFRKTVPIRWDYAPQDQLMLSLYYEKKIDPNAKLPVKLSKELAEMSSDSEDSFSDDGDSSDQEPAIESWTDYVGCARCTMDQLLSAADGKLELDIVNPENAQLHHRLRKATMKLRVQQVKPTSGSPLVIVATDQDRAGTFEEVDRTEAIFNCVDPNFEDLMEVGAEFWGVAIAPRIRFDIIYAELEDDGVTPVDDIECDSEVQEYEGCEYVGSVEYDLEALFTNGSLELVVSNKNDEVWNSRLRNTRLCIQMEDIEWGFGSPLIVASVLPRGDGGILSYGKKEMGRTEVYAESKDPSFQVRIPFIRRDNVMLQFDVYFVIPEFQDKTITQLDVSTECEYVGTVTVDVDRHLLQDERRLRMKPELPSLTVQLRNRVDHSLDARLVALESSFRVYARRQIQKHAMMKCTFRAENLLNLDNVGKSDPFFVLSTHQLDEATWKRSQTVYVTERIMNELNPKWPSFTIDLHQLCRGDLNRAFFCTVFDWDKDDSHDIIGFCKISVAQLYRAAQTEEGILLHNVVESEKTGTLFCTTAALSAFGSDEGTPTLSNIYAVATFEILKVERKRKPKRQMKLDELGVRIIERKGKKKKVVQTFVYCRIKDLSEISSMAFRIVAENSEGKEVSGDFECPDLPGEARDMNSSAVIAAIQNRIDFVLTGRVPPSFQSLQMQLCSGNAGWNVINSPLVRTDESVVVPSNMAVTMAARRGIPGPDKLFSDANLVAQVVGLPPGQPTRRATTHPWGRWPRREQKGRQTWFDEARSLPMPPLPELNDGASRMLKKVRRKELLDIVNWMVCSMADSACMWAEGHNHAASMVANSALHLAQLECRQEMIRSIIGDTVDLSCQYGEVLHVACYGAIDYIISEIEVAEVVDRLKDRVELDAYYLNLQTQGNIPPLATLALKAALRDAAGSTLSTILHNPILLRTLADPAMLPFCTQLLMDSSNHRALHVPPQPAKYDHFVALHEDEFGHITAHNLLESRMLTVHVVEVRALPKMDLLSDTDAFATVHCGEDSAKTEVIRNCLDPKWDAKFHFRCIGPRNILRVCLFDFDQDTKSDPIGQVEIMVDKLDLGEQCDEWYPLEPMEGVKGEVVGDVHLIVHWTKPAEGSVHVDVDSWHVKDLCLNRDNGDLSFSQRFSNGARTTWQANMLPMANAWTSGVWTGTIDGTFSAYRTPNGRKLTVRVIDGRGLPKMDLSGSADPFVVLKCGTQQFRTEVEFGTKRPHWDEEFSFNILPLSETLIIEMYDYDELSSNDAMGQVTIPLTSIAPDHLGKAKWYPLGPMKDVENPRGDVRLHICCPYALTPRLLMVTLVEGRNLPKKDPIHTCDPYGKIHCEQVKYTSGVQSNNQNPVWNEHFEFGVVMPGSSVTVHVFDKDRASADDPMGKVVVSLLGLPPVGDGIDTWFPLLAVPGNGMPSGDIRLRVRWTFDLEAVKQPIPDPVAVRPDEPKPGIPHDGPDFERDPTVRDLVVGVLECEELKKMDMFGQNDVYVTITAIGGYNTTEEQPALENSGDEAEPEPDDAATPELEPDSQPEPEPEAEPEPEFEDVNNRKTKRTRTIANGGAAPVWVSSNDPEGEEGEILVFAGQKRVPQKLFIRAYDEDIGRDDLIGYGTIEFGERDPFDDWEFDEWVNLIAEKQKKIKGVMQDVPTGRVHVTVKWMAPPEPPTLPKQRLYINVFEAADLKKMDVFGENDVFAIVQTRGIERRTPTIMGGGAAPKWNGNVGESLLYSLPEPPDEVKISLWDEDKGSNDLIGRGELDLSMASSTEEDWSVDKWIEVFDGKGRHTGKVRLGVKWAEPVSRLNTDKRVLHVTCYSANRLKKMDMFGDNDVYCEVHTGNKMKRTQTVENGGTSPQWNSGDGDTVDFRALDELPPNVEFRVFDEDLASSDDLIGIGFVDLADKHVGVDWEVEKFVNLADKKGMSTSPPAMIKVKIAWTKPPKVRPGRLFVTCVEGRQLRNVEGRFGENDPYLEVSVKGLTKDVVKRTVTIENAGSSPKWNEHLQFNLRSMPQTVGICCMDEDIGSSDDLIGRATVKLESMPVGTPWELERWLEVKNEKAQQCGSVHVIFRWKPHPLEDETKPVHFNISGVWHAVGQQRRTNQPLIPPFLHALPLEFTTALQMLLVAESVLSTSLVAQSLMECENEFIFQMLFRHCGAAAYETTDDDFLQQAFEEVDTDKSGLIDHEEFKTMCRRLDENMTVQEIEEAIHKIDEDGDQEITLDEFKNWWISEELAGIANAGHAGLRMLDMREKMRNLVSEDHRSGVGLSLEPGSRWRCLQRVTVHADVDLYSEEVGFIEADEVIEAVDIQDLGVGQFRILTYLGWVSQTETPVDAFVATAGMDADEDPEFDPVQKASVLLERTEEPSTASPWVVAVARHNRDVEEADALRHEEDVALQQRRKERSKLKKEIASHKLEIERVDKATVRANSAVVDHIAEFQASEPTILAQLKTRAAELQQAANARRELVGILQEHVDLLVQGVDDYDEFEKIQNRIAEVEPAVHVVLDVNSDSDEGESESVEAAFSPEPEVEPEPEPEPEPKPDFSGTELVAAEHQGDKIAATPADLTDEAGTQRQDDALSFASEHISSSDDDDDGDDEEMLVAQPDFTDFGLPTMSPMWWGTYCKTIGTILDRYQALGVIRLSKHNMLWLLSQLHVGCLASTVLCTAACLKAIVRHRLTGVVVDLLDGKHRIWSGADCRLVYKSRRVDASIVSSASEILCALLKFESFRMNESQVARLFTKALLSGDAAGAPVLRLLTACLRTNVNEGVGRIITPRDGTTKAIVLEFLTQHDQITSIVRSRLRSAPPKMLFGSGKKQPQVGSFRLALVDLVCAAAGHRYYVHRLTKQRFFASCLDLFFWFPQNNILQATVAQAFIVALASGGVNFTAQAAADRVQLLSQTRLVERLCVAVKNSAVLDFKGGRPAYSGHLFQLANHVLELSFVEAGVYKLLAGNDMWQWLVTHDLQAANALDRADWETFQLVQSSVGNPEPILQRYDAETAEKASSGYAIGKGTAATSHGRYVEAHAMDDVVGWCPSTSAEQKLLLPLDSHASDALRLGRYRQGRPVQPEQPLETSGIKDDGREKPLLQLGDRETAPNGQRPKVARAMDAAHAHAVLVGDISPNKTYLPSQAVALLPPLPQPTGTAVVLANTGAVALSETQSATAQSTVARESRAAQLRQRQEQMGWGELGLGGAGIPTRKGVSYTRSAQIDSMSAVRTGRRIETAFVVAPMLNSTLLQGKASARDGTAAWNEGRVSSSTRYGLLDEFLEVLRPGRETAEQTAAAYAAKHRNDHVHSRTPHLLRVRVVAARRLVARSYVVGKPTPFAVVRYGRTKYETEVSHDESVNPVWEPLGQPDSHEAPRWQREFRFRVPHNAALPIAVELYDHHKSGGHDPLGKVTLGIEQVVKACEGQEDDGATEALRGWFPLKRMSGVSAPLMQGEMLLSLAVGWEKRTLRVSVMAARDLPPMDGRSGLADPYCKVSLDDERFQTRVVEKSLEPVWGTLKEEYDFHVVDFASSVNLRCEVWDHDMLSKDDLIGCVLIPVDSIPGRSMGATDDSDASAAEPHTAWFKLKCESDGRGMKSLQGEVQLKLKWLSAAEAEDAANAAAEEEEAGQPASLHGVRKRRRREPPTKAQLPRLCAALLHAISEDDGAAVAGLLQRHRQLLPYACGLPIGGVDMAPISADMLAGVVVVPDDGGTADLSTQAHAQAQARRASRRGAGVLPPLATPLHAAARSGSLCSADALLRAAASSQPPMSTKQLLERRDPNGQTALHWAARAGMTGLCVLLVRGWKANVLSFDWGSPRKLLPIDLAEEAQAKQGGNMGTCAEWLYATTTEAACDGRDYTVIDGRVFGQRRESALRASAVARDFEKFLDPSNAGAQPAATGVLGLAQSLAPPEGEPRPVRPPADELYYVPTTNTVPDPQHLGHGRKGAKVQLAVEGTMPTKIEQVLLNTGIKRTRVAAPEKERDDGAVAMVKAKLGNAQRAVSGACAVM